MSNDKQSLQKLLRVLVILFCIAAIVFAILLIYTFPLKDRLLGDVHYHADFKVYLDNEAFNFSKKQYMSSNDSTLSPFVHLHDLDGEVIHKHIRGVTVGEFFDSIGMSLNKTCFVLDTGQAYCNTAEKKLSFYVNGESNNRFDMYDFQDLDRILISYGDSSHIDEQLASVTDKACIQSGTCPERGSPSDESSCTSAGCTA